MAGLVNMAALPGSGRPPCLKENTLSISDKIYNAADVIDGITSQYGKGSLLACVKMHGYWQVTVKDNALADEILDRGLNVRDETADITGIVKNFLTVSFFGVPAYLNDDAIVRKLEEYGCSIRGPVVRKHYRDQPAIENGTRFVRVELPAEVKSLPYAVRLEETGPFVRLIHTNQNKVCNNCLDEDHLVYNCPKYQCKKCNQFGHIERVCENFVCYQCGQVGHRRADCPTLHAEQQNTNNGILEHESDSECDDNEMENETDYGTDTDDEEGNADMETENVQQKADGKEKERQITQPQAKANKQISEMKETGGDREQKLTQQQSRPTEQLHQNKEIDIKENRRMITETISDIRFFESQVKKYKASQSPVPERLLERIDIANRNVKKYRAIQASAGTDNTPTKRQAEDSDQHLKLCSTAERRSKVQVTPNIAVARRTTPKTTHENSSYD